MSQKTEMLRYRVIVTVILADDCNLQFIYLFYLSLCTRAQGTSLQKNTNRVNNVTSVEVWYN